MLSILQLSVLKYVNGITIVSSKYCNTTIYHQSNCNENGNKIFVFDVIKWETIINLTMLYFTQQAIFRI